MMPSAQSPLESWLSASAFAKWRDTLCRSTQLHELQSTKKDQFVFSFLRWANENHLSMGWSLQVHLLLWMKSSSMPLSTEVVIELLAGCALAWTRADLSDLKGILIASSLAPEIIVHGLKRSSPASNPGVLQLRVRNSFHSSVPSALFTLTDGSLNDLKWQEIPR